jgi:hypothetical protein
MLNAGDAAEPVSVIDYANQSVAAAMAAGQMNTDEGQLLLHIQRAVRRGHPQMRTWPIRGDRIALVGSGPSLTDTAGELRQAIWEGAQLVTMNGGYHWCIEHNLQPKTQIVMDARPSNARFVDPVVPGCRYVIASQCAPETWDAVEGRPDVWIWHAVVHKDDPISAFLDDFYLTRWFGVGGGTTVATRALTLLRMAGYVRFDLFGIDCCWMGGAHHAIAQPENANEQRMGLFVGDRARPETMRQFYCAPWHLKQFEDLATMLKINGSHYALTAHGDGMLAYILRTLGTDADQAVVRPCDQSLVGEER